jgi:Ca2+-binding RTX toxin-like protein
MLPSVAPPDPMPPPTGGGPVLINGTDGNDSLWAFHYAATIHGLGGNDTIRGDASSDLLFGENGNDTLFGGRAQDTIDGGTGNDTLEGGAGADRLVGGDGIDAVSYASATIGVMLDLANGGVTNDASGDIYAGIEKVFGSS